MYLLNLPNNNDTKLVAAHITDTGIEHAIVVPLIKAFEPRTGEALYHADLQMSMNGTNPYTGKADLVDNLTDIVLWNNATSGVSFDDDHGATLTVLLNSSELLTRQLRQPLGMEIASSATVVAPPATVNSTDNQTSASINQTSTSINQTLILLIKRLHFRKLIIIARVIFFTGTFLNRHGDPQVWKIAILRPMEQ